MFCNGEVSRILAANSGPEVHPLTGSLKGAAQPLILPPEKRLSAFPRTFLIHRICLDGDTILYAVRSDFLSFSSPFT